MNTSRHLEHSLWEHWPTGATPMLMIPFDCLWTKKDGKRVLFKKAGSIINFKEVDDLLRKGMALSFEKKVHTPWFYQGQTLLSQLKVYEEQETPSPLELQQWRIDTLNWMNGFVFQHQEDISYMDFCFLCEQVFGFSDEDLKNYFMQLPLEVQKKNFIAACTGVFLAMGLGYVELSFIKELFIVYMFFDFPLASRVWSKGEKETLMAHWRGELKQEELGTFCELLESYKRENLGIIAQYLTNKSLIKYLEWSFEDMRGTGYLHGVRENEMSELDCLSILVYHFSMDVDELSDDLKDSLLSMVKSKSNDFRSRFYGKRLERMLMLSFQEAKGQSDDYLEIEGL